VGCIGSQGSRCGIVLSTLFGVSGARNSSNNTLLGLSHFLRGSLFDALPLEAMLIWNL